MAAGNSIEVFNCSLCSFCETSLDGLACHIRQHIKPEPVLNDSNARDCSNSLDGSKGNVSDSVSRKHHEQPGDVLASTISQLTNSSTASSKNNNNIIANNKSATPPNIEVSDPRTISQQELISTSLHNARHNVIANQSTSAKQPPHLSYHGQQHHQPAPMSKNSVGGATMASPHPPMQHGMVITHNDGMRYPQLQQQHLIEMKTMTSPYGTPPLQHSNKPPFHKTDYVPIAPAFQEAVAIPSNGMDYRRNGHLGKQHNSVHPNMQTPMFIQQQQKQQHQQPTSSSHLIAQMPVNNDARMRPLQVFPTYQSYHTPGSVDDYPFAQRQHTSPQQQQQRQHQQRQHHQQQQQHHQQQSPHPYHVSQHHPKISTPVYHQYANKGGDKKQHSPPQVQSQLNNIDYSHITKQSQNVSVPNSGTIISNPEKAFAALMNSISKDQLAGLLVVPLKKTNEIGVQTDPVEVTQYKDVRRLKDQNTCGMQTELRMQHITEVDTRTHVPLFDNIRSTKDLIECFICGDEFGSDHQCQLHVTEKHTHVCQNCYHTSTDLNDHQHHVNECGKYDAELLCMDCNNSFKSIKKLNQHRIKIHGVRMPFRCGICNAPFETHDAVMSHMVSHDNDVLDFKCRYCTKVFKCSEALSKHINRHKSVDVEYQCRFCRKVFRCDAELKEHIGLAHVIVETDYEDMDRNSSPAKTSPPPNDSKTLQVKRVTSSSNRKYSLCSYCDLAFKNKELLGRHIGACTKSTLVESTQFVCDVCKEFFSTDALKRQHIKQDHRRDNGYRCPKCSKIYRTWIRLKFHTKQQHLRKVCTDCNTVFVKDHVLRKHQEEVHGKSERQEGDRVYTCSLCNATMYTLTGLMNHRRDFHPELSAMKTADQLSSATMLSVIDDPMNSGCESNVESSLHNCQQCGEGFTSSNMLNNHTRQCHDSPHEHNQAADTDTKLNSFSCQKCSASFADEKRMKNHLGLTHGERPFVCDICNKRFQYSSQIIWHMRNHRQGATKGSKISNKLWKSKFKVKSKSSSSMSFMCHFCGARFRQEKLLKNHKGTAHKIKLFSCDICSAKFGHSTELIWHVRTCKAKFLRENPGVELPSTPTVESSETTDAHSDDYGPTESNNHENILYQNDGNQNMDDQDGTDEMDNFDVNIRLTKEEGEELLKNDPEYDSNRSEYLCPLCSKTTKTITGMKTHFGRVHGVWGKETSHKVSSEKTVTIWPCRTCNQEFRSFEELSVHCDSQHGITVNRSDFETKNRHENSLERKILAVFTCGYCGVSFDNSKSVRVHSFKKHGSLVNDEMLKQWRTDTINKPAQSDNESNLSSIKTEISTITGNDKPVPVQNGVNPEQSPVPIEPRFRCPRCGAKYRSTKSLRAHSLKRHKVILSKPELLSCKVFPDEIEIQSIVINSKPSKGHDLIESRNPCDRCGRVFGNYRALFTHYRQAHRMMGPDKELLTKKLSRTEIPMQQTSTITKPQVNGEQQPQDTQVIADSVKCPKCVRIFTSHKSFVAHLFSAHRISKDQYPTYWPNGIPILPRESSTCPTCNKKCMDERAMRIHMFKAHGLRYKDYEHSEMKKEEKLSNGDFSKFSCSICCEMLDDEQALVDHEYKVHDIRKPEDMFECSSAKDIEFNGDGEIPLVSATDISPENEVGEESLHSEMIDTSSLDGNEGYNCPRCMAVYRNRRAITTHLCRVHRYKKAGIRLYFSDLSKDEDPTKPMDDEPSMEVIDADESADVMRNNLTDGNIDDVEMILPRGGDLTESNSDTELVNDNVPDVIKNVDHDSNNMLRDVIDSEDVHDDDISQDDEHSLVIDEKMGYISSNDNANDTRDEDNDDEKNDVDSDGISALIEDSNNQKPLNNVRPLPIIA